MIHIKALPKSTLQKINHNFLLMFYPTVLKMRDKMRLMDVLVILITLWIKSKNIKVMTTR